MEAILLIDDDRDTWEAVRLALEARAQVFTIDSLAAALNFLRTRSHEVCGVIVDLNLTEGSDNFGREILERLREMSLPCVVFSSSIRTPEDAKRYQNEFGVLGTIGKGGTNIEGAAPLQQLRESVDKMISVSLGQLRERILGEVERELSRREETIAIERRRSDELVEEVRRVTGSTAANKLANSESVRIGALAVDAKSIRESVINKIENAQTIRELERLRTETLQTLGLLG
jgi:CheY-like chemotaxis protein